MKEQETQQTAARKDQRARDPTDSSKKGIKEQDLTDSSKKGIKEQGT